MNSIIKQICYTSIVAALTITTTVIPAHAAEIVVNGETVTPLDLIVLINWNCGNEVPEGRYWLDYTSGAMGFENGPAEGVLPCYPLSTQSNQPSVAPSQAPREGGDSESPYQEDRMCAKGLCGGIIINPAYQ